MLRLSEWLHQLWFPAMPATRLALIRIAVGLFAFWYVAQRLSMFLEMNANDPFYFKPLGVVWWLTEPLSLGALKALLTATLLANVAFIAGWRFRYTGPLYSVLLLVLLCYRNSWTMIYHSDNAMVFHVLILGFTAAADAWSADAWFRSKPSEPTIHWRYGWPIQLLCGVTLSTYFLSGVAKLAGELGWGWVSGEALRSQVAVDAIRKSLLGEPPPELAFALYEHLWLFTLIGVLSLVTELLAPAAIFSRRLGMFWALNAFAMHWGILFVMGITFRYQLLGIVFLSFFPAERIVEPIERLLASLSRGRRQNLPQATVEEAL
jgi:hypothetical protein